jgi:hypothetical protein
MPEISLKTNFTAIFWPKTIQYFDQMTHQTLAEQEQPFIQALKENTGKNFEEWLQVIADSDITERRALMAWLQEEQGLEYTPSHRLTHLFLEDRELNGPKVYYGDGRDGRSVFYQRKGTTIEFWLDISYGDPAATVRIPSGEHWESVTGTSIEEREKILTCIGKQMVKDQTEGAGSFQIDTTVLAIYRHKIDG